MDNSIDFQKLFVNSKNELDTILKKSDVTEHDFLELVTKLSLDKNFFILENDKYNFEELSKLFRAYEEELKESFLNDKILFEKILNCYVLLLETFTQLLKHFSTDAKRRVVIDTFFQYIKETLNMVKFLTPLEQKHINLLNNIIGEQLYYYTHFVHIEAKNEDIHYLFDKYLLYFEKIVHGFELSQSTNFGNMKEEEVEYNIFINNSSFLLLKMIHKIKHSNSSMDFYTNRSFKEIVDLFHSLSKSHKNLASDTLDDFYDLLYKEFEASCKQLSRKLNYNIIDEKISLLELNTDEYKQLIDIISTINHKETAGK